MRIGRSTQGWAIELTNDAACPPNVTRTTRVTALARNRLVLALASEYVVPHVAVGSPLESLLAERMQRNGI